MILTGTTLCKPHSSCCGLSACHFLYDWAPLYCLTTFSSGATQLFTVFACVFVQRCMYIDDACEQKFDVCICWCVYDKCSLLLNGASSGLD